MDQAGISSCSPESGVQQVLNKDWLHGTWPHAHHSLWRPRTWGSGSFLPPPWLPLGASPAVPSPVLTLRAGQVSAAALEIPGEGRRGESGLFAEWAGGRSPSRIYKPHRTSPPGKRTTCPEGVSLPVGWGTGGGTASSTDHSCWVIHGGQRGGARAGARAQGPRAPLACVLGETLRSPPASVSTALGSTLKA